MAKVMSTPPLPSHKDAADKASMDLQAARDVVGRLQLELDNVYQALRSAVSEAFHKAELACEAHRQHAASVRPPVASEGAQQTAKGA